MYAGTIILYLILIPFPLLKFLSQNLFSAPQLNFLTSQLNFLVPQLKVLGAQFEAYWLSEGLVAIKWVVAA